jgi:hypothetical protein
LAAAALGDGLVGHDAALITNLTTLQLICSAVNEERREMERQP